MLYWLRSNKKGIKNIELLLYVNNEVNLWNYNHRINNNNIAFNVDGEDDFRWTSKSLE